MVVRLVLIFFVAWTRVVHLFMEYDVSTLYNSFVFTIEKTHPMFNAFPRART